MICFNISESANADQIESIQQEIIEKIFELYSEQFETAYNFIGNDLYFPAIMLNRQIIFSGYDLFTGFDRFYRKSKSFADFVKSFDEYRPEFTKTVQSYLARQGIINVYYKNL